MADGLPPGWAEDADLRPAAGSPAHVSLFSDLAYVRSLKYSEGCEKHKVTCSSTEKLARRLEQGQHLLAATSLSVLVMETLETVLHSIQACASPGGWGPVGYPWVKYGSHSDSARMSPCI